MICVFLKLLLKLLGNNSKEEIIEDTLRVRINKRLDLFSFSLLKSKLKNNKSYRNVFFWRVENWLITQKKQFKHRGNKIGLVGFIYYYFTQAIIRFLLSVLRNIYPPVETIEISVLDGKLGKGFYLPHKYCVITAKEIGENVTVHQGVTIGKDHKTGGVPTIGNNVVIFPNAIIIGDIHIGDNVYIGANTFVCDSVPSNSTVKSEKACFYVYNKSY